MVRPVINFIYIAAEKPVLFTPPARSALSQIPVHNIGSKKETAA